MTASYRIAVSRKRSAFSFDMLSPDFETWCYRDWCVAELLNFATSVRPLKPKGDFCRKNQVQKSKIRDRHLRHFAGPDRRRRKCLSQALGF